MKTVYKFFVIFFYTITMLSCGPSAYITSNKREGYSKKLTKVYILTDVAAQAKVLGEQISQNLVLKLKEFNVEAIYSLRDPLTLETESDLEAKIQKFNAAQLMTLKQTTINSINGKINGGTFEISIIDGDDKKIAWKGLLDISYGDFGNSRNSANAALNRFVTKLAQDGLLPTLTQAILLE